MKELTKKIPSKHLVVQHNNLIASKYDLNLSEMRLILEAIHQVEKDDVDFKEYKIDVDSFLELVNTKNVSEYSRVKEFCKTILSKPLEIPKENGNFLYCNWFSHLEFDPKYRSINYSFDPKLKPYLIELKEKFTKFDIRILLKFKSFYALRIYMLLKTEIWKGKKVEYIVKVDDFRIMLKLENKYKLYGHFKNRVLEIAKKYINEVSDIEIDYEDIKLGRKVESIRFKVKYKSQTLEDNSKEGKIDFKTFKNNIIENYINNDICNCIEGYELDVVISLNAAGFLKNKNKNTDLTPDAAKSFWQWLFVNKDRVGNIKEKEEIKILRIERNINQLIGKYIENETNDENGNIIKKRFRIKKLIEKRDDKYQILVTDEKGNEAKTPNTYTLENINNISI